MELKGKKDSIAIITRQNMNSMVIEFSSFDRQTSIILNSQSHYDTLEVDLPIRFALINNSTSPVIHLCDVSMCVVGSLGSDSSFILQLDEIQVDNQMAHRVHFPVVLETSAKVAASLNSF